MDRSLYLAKEVYARTRAALLTDFPELGDDQMALVDTLEGETDLQALLAQEVRSAIEDEAFAEALTALITKMVARKQRLLERAQRRRADVVSVMTEANLSRLKEPDFTASVTTGKRPVLITDEALIPDSLCRIVTTRLPEKFAIAERLKAGEEVPGAELGNGQATLTVRR